MRYFINLGFDGSNYHGWQRQKNTQTTVQECIEDTLLKLFKKQVTVYGCGRTDTGVHASQYVIHINLDEAPEFDLKFRLNKNLPDSIAVFEVIEVTESEHARYSARARTYDYFMHLEKDPILTRHSTYCEHMVLDIDLMKKVTSMIRKTTDFRAVCKKPELYKHTLCKISNCELYYNKEQSRLRFTITGDRFLRGMVRFCIYFLLEVGRGKMTLNEFEQILNQERILKDKKPAPPNGLFLSKVEYPAVKLNDSHYLIKMLKLGLE